MKKSSLYAMIERQEIPHYRIGRLARFKPSEIEEWLLAKKCEGCHGQRHGYPGNERILPQKHRT
jgi:excisionase family DNA binding protein